MDYMKYITIQVIKKTERSEVVFAAMDEMDMPVVVKRLQGANPEIYRGIAKLRSAHIPKIYYVEEQGDELCIAEEYIDGRTLDLYLAEVSLTGVQKLELMVQLCEALEVLHSCNPPIIHRDIKPSNILVTADGVLKIIDFDASRRYKTEKNTSDTRLLGTVEYAAPEQFGYSQTDVRSDIYSAGVVFSEMKTGKEASFAGALKRLIDKCTSFDPENRYRTVTDLKKDLLKCIERETYPVWKRWLASSMVTAVLLCVLVAGGVQQYREKEEGFSEDLPGTSNEQVTGNVQQPTEADLTGTPQLTEEPETVTPGEPQTPVTKPEEVTEFEIPEIRPGYRDENGNYKTGKRVVGEWSEKIGYSGREMRYTDSHEVSWSLDERYAICLNFDKLHGSIEFELPVVVDMSYCNRMVVSAKNEVGDIAIVLYDENHEEVDRVYLDKTEVEREFFFHPKTEGRVEYVGFMANDEELKDYDEFETMISYVDFYTVNPEDRNISYEMTEFKVKNYYFLNSIKWDEKKDGSVFLNYNRVYGEVQLVLPEPVDLQQCRGVSVVMDTGGEAVTVKLFDEEFRELECSYDHITEGMQEELLNLPLESKVYGIGLMLDEVNGSERTEYEDCEVTVQSIRFYKKQEYKEES